MERDTTGRARGGREKGWRRDGAGSGGRRRPDVTSASANVAAASHANPADIQALSQLSPFRPAHTKGAAVGAGVIVGSNVGGGRRRVREGVRVVAERERHERGEERAHHGNVQW